MENNTTSGMITLRTYDGKDFIVPEPVAMQAQIIRHMIEDDMAREVITLPNVSAKILPKVIEYCKRQVDAPDASKATDEGASFMMSSSPKTIDEMRRKWEEKFLDVDQETLFDLIRAADYLDIKKLLNLTCQKVADMINGKTVEEIRETFHIVNDYTPEEEEEVRLENRWAFE